METSSDLEMHARVTGVQATMETFENLFGFSFGEHILKHTDNMSHTIQNPFLTTFEAQDLTKKVIQILLRIGNDEAYDLLWERMLLLQSEKRVSDPVLPCKRRSPAHLEVGSFEGYHPATPKDFYWQHYFECLDLIIRQV